MESTDFEQVLAQCRKSASHGHKTALAQYKNLNAALSKAKDRIEGTLADFNSSACYVSSATDLLEQQLHEIESTFDELSFAFKEDLDNLRENLSSFSITLFGRTMAGKSTLMEILTQGTGESIGKGSQRTTRDVRTYTWNGLEITDVPGIGAFEGEDDEQIAFAAAKRADIILFLLTDDAPQAAEAECFGQIVSLGKPVICIMNVKASASEGKSYKLLARDIDKSFNSERLNTIKNQFLSYADKLGQDWGQVPFVYVHLKSAFMAQNCDDPLAAERLNTASRIDDLKDMIVKQVSEKGNYYRIKTFIDIISNPMLNSMDQLLQQSLLNSVQGRVVLSKKQQLQLWKRTFTRRGKQQIHSLIIYMKDQLKREIAGFAEEHYADKDAGSNWTKLLKKRGIEEDCQQLLSQLEGQCDDKIKEVSREVSQELRFSAAFAGDNSLRMKKIINGQKIVSWTADAVFCGLSIGAIVAGACGAAAAGPLGVAAAAVAIVGIGGDLLLKKKDKKVAEARTYLESRLRENVDSICNDLESQMTKNFESLIEKRIVSLINELDRMHEVVSRLAEIQKELAWGLDNHLLELNFSIVKEAIRLMGAEGLEYHIEKVARVPGNSAVFMLRDGTVFPDEEKNRLQDMMSERITFVFPVEDKRVLLSHALGEAVAPSRIGLDEKAGVAHIPLKDAPPYITTRVRLAQQLTQIAVTE